MKNWQNNTAANPEDGDAKPLCLGILDPPLDYVYRSILLGVTHLIDVWIQGVEPGLDLDLNELVQWEM